VAAEFFLQIDVTEIVMHIADQPNSFVDLLDASSFHLGELYQENTYALLRTSITPLSRANLQDHNQNQLSRKGVKISS